jgi:hypothetical protein
VCRERLSRASLRSNSVVDGSPKHFDHPAEAFKKNSKLARFKAFRALIVPSPTHCKCLACVTDFHRVTANQPIALQLRSGSKRNPCMSFPMGNSKARVIHPSTRRAQHGKNLAKRAPAGPINPAI